MVVRWLVGTLCVDSTDPALCFPVRRKTHAHVHESPTRGAPGGRRKHRNSQLTAEHKISREHRQTQGAGACQGQESAVEQVLLRTSLRLASHSTEHTGTRVREFPASRPQRRDSRPLAPRPPARPAARPAHVRWDTIRSFCAARAACTLPTMSPPMTTSPAPRGHVRVDRVRDNARRFAGHSIGAVC